MNKAGEHKFQIDGSVEAGILRGSGSIARREAAYFCRVEPRGPAKMSELWSVRKTEGQMTYGRRFTITDDWTEAEKGETNEIRQTWTGVTTLILKTPANKLNITQIKQDHDAVHDSQS